MKGRPRSSFPRGLGEPLQILCEDRGLDAPAAPQPPARGYDPVDQGRLELALRQESVPYAACQGIECGSVLTVHDELLREEPMRARVLAGAPLAFRRARAGAAGRVATIRHGLSIGGHVGFPSLPVDHAYVRFTSLAEYSVY